MTTHARVVIKMAYGLGSSRPLLLHSQLDRCRAQNAMNSDSDECAVDLTSVNKPPLVKEKNDAKRA